MPDVTLSFEPGDLVEQVLNLGSTNPIEVAVVSRNLDIGHKLATQIEEKLKTTDYFRDVQISTPLDYPGLKLSIDRVRSGQLGLTVNEIARSTVAATSSSRFTQPNYWLDKSTGAAPWLHWTKPLPMSANCPPAYASGMYTIAQLILNRPAPSFVAPYTTVVTTLEEKFVIRVRNGQAEWVDVRQGIFMTEGVEIFGQLAEGDTLLVRGSEEIKPGTAINVKME